MDTFAGMTTDRLIDEADRLASLGLYLDSWEVLETLQPEEQLLPAVMMLRLQICTVLGCWEPGQEVARGIGPWDPPYHREAAGKFHLAHAIALCAAGDIAAARTALKALTMVWPEGREVALDSDALMAAW